MNKVLPAAIGAALLSLAVAAGAQQTTGTAGAKPGDMRQRMAERPFSKPTERVEARLAYIRTALKIDDRQQSQWDAYAAQVRKSAQEMEARIAQFRSQRPARGERPNAVARLEQRQALHANAVVRLNELLAVQKPLYAVLSPEQQKIADVVLVRGPGGRDAGGHGHRGPGGMRGMQRG